ncbi:MAG TPA: YbaK/EbsC family protein [Actinomycetota bacterium]
MDCTERLEGYLRENGVSFEVQKHPVAYTAQKVAASEHVPGRMFAKVVMVEADRELVMLVVPASAAIDTARVENVLGGRPVRLAAEREFAPRFPDCEAGAMPPFGNLYDVPVVVERALGENDHIVFQAGTHDTTMSVAYEDFERLVRPSVGEIAAR